MTLLTKNYLLFTIFLLFSQLFFAQETRTISGFVTDGRTGEKLIGALVYDTSSQKSAGTNEYGFFSLSIPAKETALSISSNGLQPVLIHCPLGKDEINVALVASTELEEFTIRSTATEIKSSSSGTIELQLDKVEKLPLILGEKDIMRVIQLLPGVQSGGEGSSGIYVRGGGADQNLILLDGVPIYNASHLFGFFSTFNSDAISNVTLIKGGFPSRYGGRASSVLDIRMKEGNMKNYNVEGSVGLISSKILVEGPIKKDKTAFSFSARRTYLDVLMRPFLRLTQNTDAGYFFHDFNAKVHHKINDKHHLYISGYFGLDRVFASTYGNEYNTGQGTGYTEYKNVNKSRLQWGNSIGSVRWNYKASPKLFVNTTATYSRYHFNVGMEDETKIKYADGSSGFDRNAFVYKSGIVDWGIKTDFTFIPNPNHNIKFGLGDTYHTFTPGITVITAESDTEKTTDISGSRIQYSNEIFLYAEDDFKIGKRLKINAGIHHGALYTGKKWYHIPQPRLSANYVLNDKSSLKIGVSRMAQFLHLLSNSGIGLPTDLWVPATAQIKPVTASQYSLGYYRELNRKYVFSTEVFYKKMNNLIQYKEGTSFASGNQDWQQKVTTGQGWAYGAEFFVEKKKGDFTGWIGYTLSWSERQFDELNFGKKFYHRYDRRHDLSIALTYDINEKWDVGLVFVYGTGNAVTIGTQDYSAAPNPAFNGMYSGFYSQTLTNFDQMNGYRMPAYHRLDLGANRKKIKKYGISILSLSIYNVYNRQNAFMIQQGYNKANQPALMQVSLFPLIPSISWKFKFDFAKIKENKLNKVKN